MRAVLLLAAFVTFGACSSNETGPPAADAGNGSNRALGTTCIPSLADACEQPSDACSIAVCDPTSRLCVRVAVDAGPACSNGSPQVPDAAMEAGEASVDASVDGADASVPDASSDAATDGEGGDASTDAPFDASDSGED